MAQQLLSFCIVFITICAFQFVQSDDVPSNKCALVRCMPVNECPLDAYLENPNPEKGVCCGYCKLYAREGESCDESASCYSDLICDDATRKCIVNPNKCALIQCSPPKCDNGHIVYDLNTSCCPFCADN